MVTKECPLCGEMMKLRQREVIDRVPGSTQTRTIAVNWKPAPANCIPETAEPGFFWPLSGPFWLSIRRGI